MILVAAVGHESFIFWLNEHRYVAVEFTTVQGQVVSFVVRLMTCAHGEDRILSRFDTAHGIAHQDLLTRNGGLREKRWLPDLNFNQALAYAIDHFKSHHEDYPG
ncbi:MAG: hypothetical protein EXS37_11935 [Opitutus sp.]|nr:hypothetical protein [Opitutus sp.]